MRVALISFACAVVPAVGVRVSRKTDDTSYRATWASMAQVEAGSQCDALSGLVAGGTDWTDAAVTVCKYWPSEKMGEFPVGDINEAQRLMGKALGENGYYSQLEDLMLERKDSSTFCWRPQAVRPVVAGTCKKKYWGKCYADCPANYESVKLNGKLGPGCSAICKATSHRATCGFGCASSRWKCWTAVMKQVRQVAVSLSSVKSYLTGDPDVAKSVNQMISLTEFVAETLWKVVKKGKYFYSGVKKETSLWAMITVVVELVNQHGAEVGMDLKAMQKSIAEIIDLTLTLASAEYSWHQVDVDFIKETLLGHGDAILEGGFEFASAFTWPTCEFTV